MCSYRLEQAFSTPKSIRKEKEQSFSSTPSLKAYKKLKPCCFLKVKDSRNLLSPIPFFTCLAYFGTVTTACCIQRVFLGPLEIVLYLHLLCNCIAHDESTGLSHRGQGPYQDLKITGLSSVRFYSHLPKNKLGNANSTAIEDFDV